MTTARLMHGDCRDILPTLEAESVLPVSWARLIADARSLAGDPPCTQEHDWVMDGGRACESCGGSQPVFICSRCGEYDYGEHGGPGAEYCAENMECQDARSSVELA